MKREPLVVEGTLTWGTEDTESADYQLFVDGIDLWEQIEDAVPFVPDALVFGPIDYGRVRITIEWLEEGE